MRRFWIPTLILGLVAGIAGCPDGEEAPATGSLADPNHDHDGDGFCEEEPCNNGEQGGDCDDSDADVHPGLPEECDGVDTNCDGLVGDGEVDSDGDGEMVCSDPGGVGDCDDSDADLNHADSDGDGWGTCDGDCDDTDEALNLDDVDGDSWDTCHGDCDDEDGSVDPGDADEDGVSSCDGDCDDTDDDVYPGATEACDGVDNDCDGELPTDEVDDDGDGQSDCEGDCDDAEAAIFAGAHEICDGLDNDCDEATSEDEDDDGDGFTECEGDCDDGDARVSPATVELCDGVDNDCDGDSDTDCLDCVASVPGDQATIQDAIDQAAGGGRICVLPGTYVENISIESVAIHLLAIAGPEYTTLDGDGMDSVLRLATTSSSVNGFTVTGGSAVSGGGIHLLDAEPTLVGLVVSGNAASDHGGGIHVSGASALVIEDSIFENNTAGLHGGGIALDGADLSVRNTVVHGNTAGEEAGGLFATNGATVSLQNVLIAGNGAGTDGGGVTVSLGAVADFLNVVVSGNTATGNGGGVSLAAGGSLSAVHMTTYGNVGEHAGGIDVGAAGTLQLNAVDVSGNEALVEGGGIRVGAGSVTLTFCNAIDNLPEDYLGLDDPTGLDGNVSAFPQYLDVAGADPLAWDLHLGFGSALVDAGPFSQVDPDKSRPDIGCYGGSGAASWDLDLDTYVEWWQPGPYDPVTYPAAGLDCDDGDPDVYPGEGC